MKFFEMPFSHGHILIFVAKIALKMQKNVRNFEKFSPGRKSAPQLGATFSKLNCSSLYFFKKKNAKFVIFGPGA